MGVVVLTSDLVLQSRLRAAGQRVGIAVEIATASDVVATKVEEAQPRLVVLDLAHRGLDPAQLVPQLKALVPAVSVVAFGPHVHPQRLAAATAAGCDLVKSRGAFHAEMDAILRRFAG